MDDSFYAPNGSASGHICSNIVKPAFQNNGILYLLENKKNELNPTDGQNIKITTSDNGKSGFKSGIATVFGQLDKEIINLIGLSDAKENIHIISFLKEISQLKN